MKSVRIISAILFYFSRLIAIPYLLSGIYLFFTIAFKTGSLNIVKDGKIFEIFYPFTRQPFLIGEYHTFYIVEMVLFLMLYGLFFWLLGDIFKTFRQQRLFTVPAVKRLQIFYVINFLVPLAFLIVHLILWYEVETLLVLTVLHAVLGVFAYFMAAIFKQGLSLQKEQDLFI